MQQADRDGIAPVAHQMPGCSPDLILRDGRENLARVERALGDPDPPVPGHQRAVRLDELVEHRAAEILDAAAHLDHVPESRGRDQADPGSPVGEQHVGAEGRAVHDPLHIRQELL